MTHEKKEMTNEEAVRYMEGLQRLFTQYRPIFSGNMVKANGKAIEALEKQIPKKILAGSENCPSCGEEVVGCEFYCWACGQKLEW